MSKTILSRNIKYLMKKRGLNQTRLAAKLGMKVGTPGPWIRGKSYPRMEQYIKLCDALDCQHLNILLVDVTKGEKAPKKQGTSPELVEKLEIIQQLVKEALKQ